MMRAAAAVALGAAVAQLSPLGSRTVLADATWTGATSQDWNTGTNWDTNPPTGNFTINTATGNYPTLSTTSAFTPVDLIIGSNGNSGRLDQSGGTLSLANTGTNGNWMFVGRGGGTGTYNLTGSGSLAVGKLWLGGMVYDENGTGTVTVNTSGSITASSTDANGGFGGQTSASVIVGWGSFPSGSSTATLNLQNGTINANAGSTNGLGMYVGAWGSHGTVNQTGGTINTSQLSVGRWFGTGVMNITNGTVNASSGVWLARGGAAGDSIYGTMNVNNGGVVNSEADFVTAFAGDGGTPASAGILNIDTGGTVNVGTTTERWFIVNQWDTVQGQVNVNGGTLNLNANTDLRFSTGNGTGTSVVNLNSGAITGYSGNKADLPSPATNSNVVDLNRAGAAVNNTFNLNGGTLTISQVITTNDTGTVALNFNGGTLKANADTANFVNLGGATQVANVRNGGAIIDSNGHNVTIVQPLVHSTISGDNATDGGLTKNGAGVLTLTGNHTYNGPTTINGGALAVNGSLASSVTVAAGNSFTAGGASTVSGLSFPGAATFTLDLGTQAAGNPAVLNVTNALNIGSGTVTLNVNHTGPIGSGTYALATAGSITGNTANLTLGTIQGLNATRQTATLGTTGTTLSLTINGAVPIWHGLTSTNWSTNTADTAWNVNGTDSFFLNGDVVLFNDTASSGTVNVVGTVNPTSMTFDNSTVNYTVGGSGTIGGTASLTKLGTGTLTIANANTYSGGTTMSAGQLNINNNAALGTGTLTTTAAVTVDNTSASPVAITNPVKLGGNLTVGGTTDLALNGAVTGTGNLVKNGAAKLTVGGNSTYAGTTTVSSGTLAVTGSLTGSTGVFVNGGGNVTVGGTLSTTFGQVNNGSVTVAGGTLNDTGDLWMARGNGGAGDLQVQSGGTVNGNVILIGGGDSPTNIANGTGSVATGGTINTTRWLVIGHSGATGSSGSFAVNGGTVNVRTTGTQGNIEVGTWDNIASTFDINSGNVNLLNNSAIVSGAQGPHTGTSVTNQNGGNVTFYSDAGTTIGGTGAVLLGAAGTGNHTYNLNGGVLTTPAVRKDSGGATGTFNFNGGTLKATPNSTTLLRGLSRVNVRNGGAIIDTNGANVSVNQMLEHSNVSGDNATDGGFTKTGAGTLRLGGVASYTGGTVISGGTLQLPTGAAPLPVGSYSFDNVLNGTTPVTSGSLSDGYVVKNGGSGTGMDGVVNNNDNLFGAGTPGGSIVAGKFGNALSLDGTGSSIDIASKIVDQAGGGTWTLSTWIKTTTVGSTMLSKNGGGITWANGHSVFYLGSNPIGSTGSLPTAVRNGGNFLQGDPAPVSLTEGGPNGDGVWRMVTFVDNGGTKSIYVDGVLVPLTQTAFNNADTATLTRLGFNVDSFASSDGNAHFAGLLDEMKFYDTALTASQIQSLFASNAIAGGGQQYLPTGTAVSIPVSGATLDLNGNNQVIGSLSGVAGSSVALGAGSLTFGGDNTSTTFAGAINGTGGITKAGTGTVTLSGANTYAGATTATGGKLVLGASLTTSSALAANGGTIEVAAGAAPAGDKIIKTASVSASGGGTVDLKNNKMILTGNAASGVRSLISSGQLSTTATAPAGKTAGLGYAQGDDSTISGLGGSLGGESFTAADTIVKFTYFGDADLDGDVDGVDVGKWATNFTGSGGSTAKVWTQGDWDYDGDVDGVDVGRWATNFTGSGGGVLDIPGAEPAAVKILDSMGFTVVPEPTSLGLLGVAGLALSRRRRRQRGA
jgi:autotransporter-associated beta strand protein